MYFSCPPLHTLPAQSRGLHWRRPARRAGILRGNFRKPTVASYVARSPICADQVNGYLVPRSGCVLKYGDEIRFGKHGARNDNRASRTYCASYSVDVLTAPQVFLYVESAADAVQPPPLQGFFKKYRLRDPLGKGGFGKVYRAEHTRTRKMFAVKVTTPDVVARRPRPNGRLIAGKEVELMQKLTHPNIVQIVEYFLCEGDEKLCTSGSYACGRLR